MARPIEPLESRLARQVDRSGSCWMWLGVLDAYGYGVISYGAKAKLKAHRVAWELEHGAIPDGLTVCHTCDTPACVNPAHLFIGTQGDNMRDAAAKGRHFVPTPPALRGAANPASRLTDAQREEIRSLAGDVTQRELAKRFGVSQTTINRVLVPGSSSGKAA